MADKPLTSNEHEFAGEVNRTRKDPDALPPTIGSYKILEKIGEGGYGVVYKAETHGDIKVNDEIVVKNGEVVAVKVLNAINDEERSRRFKRGEINIAKELKCDYIIKIRDYGEDDQKRPYIVMDYVEGISLAGLLQQGPLDRAEAVRIVECVAKALSCAHTFEYQDETGGFIKGVIHRDIKPDNILLDKRADPSKPLLTDFGIAKVIDSNIVTKTVGTPLGTFEYMSPEQFMWMDVTPATDLYALAIVLFKMLTGEHPFARVPVSNETGFSPVHVRWQVLHCNHPPANLSEITPKIKPLKCFDPFFSKAMSKDPVQRYQNADEFIDAMNKANAEAQKIENQWPIDQEHARNLYNAALTLWETSPAQKDMILNILNQALSLVPELEDALILMSRVLPGEEKIPPARQACEQAKFNLTSEACIHYLETLREVGDSYLGIESQRAVEHYHSIANFLGGEPPQTDRIADIWTPVRERLIKHHYDSGRIAYAGGNPKDLDQAIEVLQESHTWLVKLGAHGEESERLLLYHKLLQIKKFQEKIKVVELQRQEIESRLVSHREFEEEYLQTYRVEADCYKQLLNIEPNSTLWQEHRGETWEKLARECIRLAKATERERNYTIAVKYYDELLKIKGIDYPELPLDKIDSEFGSEEKLAKKAKDLEDKIGYDDKYKEINELIKDKKYQRAMNLLEKIFRFESVYQFENVAQLFWIVTYALDKDGQLPPELTSVEELKAKLATTQQELSNTQQEKETLKKELTQEITQTRAELDAAKLNLTKAQTLQTQLAQAEQKEQQFTKEITQLHSDIVQNSTRLKEGETFIPIGATVGAIALMIVFFVSWNIIAIVSAVIFWAFGIFVYWRYFRS